MSHAQLCDYKLNYGVKSGRFGRERPFLPKNYLKTAILAEQILDRLTSEGAGTPILKLFGTFDVRATLVGAPLTFRNLLCNI